MKTRAGLPMAILMIGWCTGARSEDVPDAAEDVSFFERKIRPVLVESCYECHAGSEGAVESGLRLDTRAAIRAGGDRGPAVVPGKPDESWLIKSILRHDDDLQMPPDGDRLSDEVVEDFITWVRRGAADPRHGDGLPTRPEAENFWAYQPLAVPRVPNVDTNWPRTSLDAFVWERLKQQDLEPSPDAEPSTLLRRLHFDLTGLPPTGSQLDQFQRAVESLGIETALRRTVDHLILQPEFGERWGRHWLDIARFGESSGKEANITFPYAWRYRDYVIDRVSDDCAIDRFIKEQLAGDLLPASDDRERTRLLIATGFLAVGPKNLDATDPLQFSADVVDEQIDAVTRVFLASSVACARCHDHKFDPFSMEDYYALAGIFSSTKTYFGTAVSPANRVGGDPLPLPLNVGTPVLHRSLSPKRVEALQKELAALKAERADPNRSITLRDALRIFWRSGAIEGSLEKVDESGRALPLAIGVLESDQVADTPLLLRGDVHRPTRRVPRAFPVALSKQHSTPIAVDQSGRAELADWLAAKENALTWRVMANRVWSHLFGVGLVETVDDFGSTGKAPSHPELLDYLATRLVDRQFSLKRLVREIVLSRSYRQASRFDRDAFLSDPENRLLWRMSKRRIEVESMRDAMLLVAAELDAQRPLGSLVGRVIGDRPVSLVGLDPRLPPDLDGANHRSVYLPVLRDRLPDVFEVFDFAEPSLVTGSRDKTNVATQSLYLMNSEFVHRCAVNMAAKLRRESDRPRDFVTAAFQACFSRDPTPAEFERVQRFLSSGDRRQREVLACQSLMSTAEFRILD